MSMPIDDDHGSHPDDDWFAPADRSAAASGDGARQIEPGSEQPEWEPADDAEHDDREREVAHRHMGIVAAVLLAVFLVIAGFLVGRITKDSTQTVVTLTTTVQIPAETTPTESTPVDTTPADTTPADTTPTSVPADATLRPGTKGSAAVASLQAALTSLGYAAGSADGSYGASTVAAVSAFQTAKNLTADGVAGPATLAAINAALTKG